MEPTKGIELWPVQLSHHAQQVDWVILAFTALLVVLVLPVFVAMIYFAVKYRRGSTADRSPSASRNVWIETSWAVIPFLLAGVFFAWAASLYYDLFHPPANSLGINVVAKQWMWKFEHPGGQREIDTLHVPVNTPVELTMISEDVIHSLYFPALRIKQDVLPGRYTRLWFKADKVGEYHLHCAEFCGTDHARMGGSLVVLDPEGYQRWLGQAGTDTSLAAAGEALFRKYGCSGCHGANSSVRAPNLAGVYGSPVPLDGGGTVIADDSYIRDSVLFPKKQVAAGYKPIMPTFQGQVSEEDLLKLIAYIKSLS